jgi:hypothetical protein
MNISPTIYSNLSAPARVRAAVAATAREDQAELDTLRTTCPKLSYLVTDPAYGQTMQRLFMLALSNECEVAGFALDFIAASRLEEPASIHAAVIHAASIKAAWVDLLTELGIDLADMTKASPERHNTVETVLQLSEGKHDSEIVSQRLTAMRDFLAA